MKTVNLFTSIFAFILMGCSNDAATAPTIMGRIEGRVVDPTGQPVGSANVRTVADGRAATTTDSQGRFNLRGLMIEDGGTEYTISASKNGQSSSEESVELTPRVATATVTLLLPRVEAPPPGQRGAALDVRTLPQIQDSTITFHVEVVNATSKPIHDVALSDSLDPQFGTISDDRIDLSGPRFSGADVMLHPDAQGLDVSIGTLESTEHFIRVFSFSISIPSKEGIFCNTIRISGESESGAVGQRDVACVMT